MNILAGQTQDIRYDPTAYVYKPASELSEGEVFTVQTLNYWQWQECLSKAPNDLEQIRTAVQLGLVAIDGDAAKAKAFLESPAMLMVQPLYVYIVGIASGN